MASNNISKRSRASAEQLNRLVDFLVENPGLAGGKFLKMNGKIELEKKWLELTGILNSLGGAEKTVNQWQTVWRDLKSRTSVRVRDRKRQLAMTGNRPVKEGALTELEKRVMDLIGKEYIEGHASVFENVPEEEEFQLRLEDDDESVFAEIRPLVTVSEGTKSPTHNMPNTPTQKTPRTSSKRARLDDGDIRAKFVEIAKQQADSTQMLAEASMASVEIARRQADTFKTLAECNTANTEAIKMMAVASKQMGEGLIQIANALNNLANAINRFS